MVNKAGRITFTLFWLEVLKLRNDILLRSYFCHKTTSTRTFLSYTLVFQFRKLTTLFTCARLWFLLCGIDLNYIVQSYLCFKKLRTFQKGRTDTKQKLAHGARWLWRCSWYIIDFFIAACMCSSAFVLK